MPVAAKVTSKLIAQAGVLFLVLVAWSAWSVPAARAFGEPRYEAGAVTSVTETEATLHERVNVDGHEVTGCRFELYGHEGAPSIFDFPCSPEPPEEGWSELAVRATGLMPGALYTWAVVITYRNEGSTSSNGGGGDEFTTAGDPKAPYVASVYSLPDHETSTTFHAIVSPEWAQVTECVFEYGLTYSYGASISCSPFPGAEGDHQWVSATPTGLNPGRTYHFRVRAVNSLGETFSGDETFSTAPPRVRNEAATEVSQHTAHLNAIAENAVRGVEECKVEWGSTTAYGSSAYCSERGGRINEDGATRLAAPIYSAAGGVVHFRFVVVNEVGQAFGPDGELTLPDSAEAEQKQREEEERARREQDAEAAQSNEENKEAEAEEVAGYGHFVIESYGRVSGTLDVRNPPGTHLENLSGEEIDEAGLPAGSVAVVGGVSYSLQGLPAGTSVNAKFFLPPGSNPTNVFKKIKGQWVDVTYLATISGNEITFHVRDGGPGDEDGVANGVIVDPMVPVRLSSPPSRPEVGRCQAAPTAKEGSKTIYLGGYSDSKCSKAVPDTGKYKFKPGFDKGAFALSGTRSTFETANKAKISCTGLSGAGEYTGATGESLTITLSGCMNSSEAKCQSSGHPEGQIVSSLLGGRIGYISAAKGTVGVDLAPINTSEPDFADFQCAGTQERVTGSVVGQIKTIGKPAAAIEVQFKAKKGVPLLQSLEGAPPDTLSLLSGSAQSEAIGLTTKVKQTGEEALEVKG